MSEIESRCVRVSTGKGTADNVQVGIEFHCNPENLAGTQTFGDVLPMMRMLRAMIVECVRARRRLRPASKKVIQIRRIPKATTSQTS